MLVLGQKSSKIFIPRFELYQPKLPYYRPLEVRKKQVTKRLSEQIIHVEVYKLEYWMPTHYYYTCFGPAWFIEVQVLYMSFDKILLAVESRDLSQADKIIIRVSSFPSFNFWMINYSYTQKNNLVCFGQFYHSKIWKLKKWTVFSVFLVKV